MHNPHVRTLPLLAASLYLLGATLPAQSQSGLSQTGSSGTPAMVPEGLPNTEATPGALTSAAPEEIADRIAAAGPYDTLARLIETTPGALDLVAGDGLLTVFAPTDEAFSRLPETLFESLSDEDAAAAARVLLSAHLVEGWHAQDALDVSLRTLSGDRLLVTYTDGALSLRLGLPEAASEMDRIRTARQSEAQVTNMGSDRVGALLLHPIDRVLLPRGLDTALDGAPGSGTETGTEPGTDTTSPDQPALAERIANADTGAPENVVPPQSAQDGPATAQDDAPGLPDAPQSTRTTTEVVVLTPTAESETDAQNTAQATAQTDPQSDTTPSDTAANDPAAQDEAPTLTRTITSVNELVGAEVLGTDGTSLGHVADMLVALDTGRVQTIIIEEGQLFGFGGDEQRFPLSAVSVDPLSGVLIVDESSGGGNR